MLFVRPKGSLLIGRVDLSVPYKKPILVIPKKKYRCIFKLFVF